MEGRNFNYHTTPSFAGGRSSLFCKHDRNTLVGDIGKRLKVQKRSKDKGQRFWSSSRTFWSNSINAVSVIRDFARVSLSFIVLTVVKVLNVRSAVEKSGVAFPDIVARMRACKKREASLAVDVFDDP